MLVDLALRRADELPEAQRHHLGQIGRTCREMMRLIQNLLEITKIEEGKMPVAPEPLALGEVVEEVVREYSPVAEQANRRLAATVAADLPPAMADRALLRRVVTNLVVNALRHSGSAKVSLEVEAPPGQAELTLAVRDFGHGIPADEQARIFEKYRTIRRSPTDEPNSDTGLGLPFCKLAVEHMGGRIDFESTPGQGSVFRVTLPAVR
jgi:signal transduction histidine kinase